MSAIKNRHAAVNILCALLSLAVLGGSMSSFVAPASACAPAPAGSSSPTTSVAGHGIVAKGTMQFEGTLSNRWAYLTKTFTSQDLLNTYGVSAMVSTQSYFVGASGSRSLTLKERGTLFVLRFDETPFSEGVGGPISAGIPGTVQPEATPHPRLLPG